MLSALVMMGRVARALWVALREEDFLQIIGAALSLILIGTVTFSLGTDWGVVNSFYVAVATLTTSSVLDPDLTLESPWLKLFTAGYVLIGIGILVEVARRLGTAFIIAREEAKTRAVGHLKAAHDEIHKRVDDVHDDEG